MCVDRGEAVARVRRVADELAELDRRRAELVTERDVLLLEARDAGVTWVALQEAAGLTVGALRKALKRAAGGG